MYDWVLDFISVPAGADPDQTIVITCCICLTIILCFFFKCLYKVFQSISL